MPEKSYTMIRHEGLIKALKIVEDLRGRALNEKNEGAWDFLWSVSRHIGKAQLQNIRELMGEKQS